MVFLSEAKARAIRIKGIQNKINFTQGIVVLSGGRGGGLALLWREGTEVNFKSCLHSHIDVVVREELATTPWCATRFYGHLNAKQETFLVVATRNIEGLVLTAVGSFW